MFSSDSVSLLTPIHVLTRRGIFTTETTRWPGFQWDPHNTRIADELIELYFALEE